MRAGALLLVVLAGIGLYADDLFHSGPLFDEVTYEAAADLVHGGTSPYAVREFVYPPAFAHAVATTRTLLGPEASRLLWRWLELLALIWLVWMASRWGAPDEDVWTRCLICLLLVATPGVAVAMQFGNLSLLAGALIVAGLSLVESSPVRAGGILGLSFALKPLVPPALAVLAVPERGTSVERWLASRPLITSVIGGALAAVALFGFPYWSDYAGAPITEELMQRTASVLRVLDLSKIQLPREIPLFVLYLMFMASVWWLRPRGQLRTVWALTAVVVAVPLLWSHTMVVFFPVLVAAFRVALDRSQAARVREREPASRLPWWTEAVLVGSLVALILFFESAGLEIWPAWIQLLLVLPPLVSPVLLALYLTRVAPSGKFFEPR